MSNSTRDILILGGGIIGLSIAWQLARRGIRGVTVLERGRGLGEGSTGASSAVLRHRYSLDNMVALARDGISAYRNWQSFTGLVQPTATFNNDGILWLPGDRHWAPTESQRLQQLGVAAEVLDDAALADRFPAFNCCVLTPDIETGEDHPCTGGGLALFENDAGWMDPVLAAEDLRTACRAAGVEVRMGCEVKAITHAGGRVSGVALAEGQRVSAPLVINALGPWCMPLYQAAGLDIGWQLKPVRIQVVYIDRPPELEGPVPVTADIPGGIYFRTQNRGQQIIVSSVLEEDEREVVADPDGMMRETDRDFEQIKLHMLQHRLPALSYRGKVRGYCGLYTVNFDDVHPVLGETALKGLWAANGFSGHGFKLAPMIGAMVAKAISGISLADDTSVPIDMFSLEREPISLQSKSVLA